MNQNRWKSPVTIGAVAAQIVSLLITLGVIDTGKGEAINAVVATGLQMLVVFGVLNNPTDATGF